MTARKLKLIAKHGMSSNSTAWVMHDIDPDRARVIYSTKYKTGYQVEYRISMYCGKTFKRPRLFKELPTGAFRCKACAKAKSDPLYWDNLRLMNRASQWKKSHGN